MTNSYSCVNTFLTHQNAQRSVNNIASADDNTVFAGGFNIVTLQQINYARRRCRNKSVQSRNQFAKIDRVKTVNVFFRVNSLDNFLFVNVFRKRQLNDKTVNVRVVVQLFNRFQKFFLGNIVLKTNQRRFKTDLLT